MSMVLCYGPMIHRGPPSLVSGLVNTPQIQRNAPVQFSSRESVTFRTGLNGLSALFLSPPPRGDWI